MTTTGIPRHVTPRIREALSGYLFRARSEAELQAQVVSVLSTKLPSHLYQVATEVRKGGGRFDIALKVAWDEDPCRWRRYGLVVLELKMRAPVASVERQAQRYALMEDVDAVLVVTTSHRLASQLTGDTLGGKPFGVIAVRTS